MKNAVALVLVSTLVSLSAQGQQKSHELSIPKLIELSRDAVVLIETFDSSSNPLAQGSGFLISPDGQIVTNFHVLEGARSASVRLRSGASFSVSGVLASSEGDDLAVIKVEGDELPFLQLGDAKGIAVGEDVVAIASPLGFENSVSEGIVSAIRKNPSGTSLIQTTAASSHGSSGGPLLNREGKVIGVITFKAKDGENLNFALAVSSVISLLTTSHGPLPLAQLSPNTAKQEIDKGRPTASKAARVRCPLGVSKVEIYAAADAKKRVGDLACSAPVTILSEDSQGEDRIDRIRTATGKEAYIFNTYLEEVSDPAPPPRHFTISESDIVGPASQTSSGTSLTEEQELPPAEISKLEGTDAYLPPDYALYATDSTVNLYNGSNWTVNEITVLFTVLDGKKAVVLSRKYRLRAVPPKRGIAPACGPLSGCFFVTHVDFDMRKNQTFSWSIVGAKGSNE